MGCEFWFFAAEPAENIINCTHENCYMAPSQAFSESLHFIIGADGKSQLSVEATEADLVSVEVCV